VSEGVVSGPVSRIDAREAIPQDERLATHHLRHRADRDDALPARGALAGVATQARIASRYAPGNQSGKASQGMILTLEKLTMRFGGITAVSNLDLAVEEGQIFSVIGPNGAGKTTVFNAITGIY